jgi:hypothetical protein
VFVGAATIELWITDPASPPVPPTKDVDVVVELVTRAEFYDFEPKLRGQRLRRRPGRWGHLPLATAETGPILERHASARRRPRLREALAGSRAAARDGFGSAVPAHREHEAQSVSERKLRLCLQIPRCDADTAAYYNLLMSALKTQIWSTDR